MRTYRRLMIALILSATCLVSAQVPFDISKAVPVKTVMNVRVGGSVGAPQYTASPCESPGMDVVTVSSTTGGRAFKTSPRIDTSLPTPLYWNSVFMQIDYDGVPPLEYMNVNGRIEHCEFIGDPSRRTRLDTVNCWTSNILPNYSMDVDGDGYLDVVCDLLGGGMLAHVILGGPNAGKGCERVAEIHGYPNRYKSLKRAFFRSSSGRWRFVQWERGQSDLSPIMMLYDVGLKRTGNIFETTFTPLDSLYGGSSSLNDDPFGMVEELIDTVHHKDYLLVERVLKWDPVTKGVERFDITDGRFAPTGEKVTEYSLAFCDNMGHSLGTDVPVIGIDTYRGFCYFYADNITTAFAKFSYNRTGLQPARGFTVINDQTGDGKPDIVLTGGTVDGRMAVITFDQSVGVDENPTDDPRISTASIVGNQLDVTLVTSDVVSVDVATVTGQQWTVVPPTTLDVGVKHYDVATLLHNRPSGAYFLRVHIGTLVVSIPVTR